MSLIPKKNWLPRVLNAYLDFSIPVTYPSCLKSVGGGQVRSGQVRSGQVRFITRPKSTVTTSLLVASWTIMMGALEAKQLERSSYQWSRVLELLVYMVMTLELEVVFKLEPMVLVL